MSLTIYEQLLHTTARISAFSGGQPLSTGTGFFWRISKGELGTLVLVTNKHVIKGADRIEIVLHTSASSADELPSGDVVLVRLNLVAEGAFLHPDPAVDLCAVGISPILEQAAAADFSLFLRSVGAPQVPTPEQWEEFDAVEEVTMIGYPQGLFDRHNNRPLVRRGITATALGKLYDGRQEFMVDMACFPGSSGSPVFMYQVNRMNRNGSFSLADPRLYFLGILYAGPTISQSGKIIVNQQPSVEVSAMMHLGYVIRATAMLELDQLIRQRLG